MNFWKKLGIGAIYALVVCLVGVFLWFITCVSFIDNYQFAFVYNKFGGKIEKIERTGWVSYNPIQYNIHRIDLRPFQVAINANERVLNAKLVRFNPEGLDVFVEWHGRDAGDSRYNLTEILKSYAFDVNGGKDCPFLTVVQELGPTKGVMPVTTKEKNGGSNATP